VRPHKKLTLLSRAASVGLAPTWGAILAYPPGVRRWASYYDHPCRLGVRDTCACQVGEEVQNRSGRRRRNCRSLQAEAASAEVRQRPVMPGLTLEAASGVQVCRYQRQLTAVSTRVDPPAPPRARASSLVMRDPPHYGRQQLRPRGPSPARQAPARIVQLRHIAHSVRSQTTGSPNHERCIRRIRGALGCRRAADAV
jgi:hypothetical protein